MRVLERLHGRAVDPERLEPATRGWLIDSAPVTLVEYLEAAERLWTFSRRILSSWPAGSVLVTPTLTRLPATVGGLQSQAGVTDDGVRFSTLVRIWGVTGQPAISLPTHETADGVPVGVQLIGPPGRDDLCWHSPRSWKRASAGALACPPTARNTNREESSEMPGASKKTASRVEDMGIMEGRYKELGSYTVGFETFREDADAAPLMRGLPDDRCHSPHWGYVVSGRVTFTYPDHAETYENGDAYHAPPGHTPAITAGTEIIEFSPTEVYGRTMEVIGRNLTAVQAG